MKDFFSKCADLVTFTEEILNGKLHFLCRVIFKPYMHNLRKKRKFIVFNNLVHDLDKV